VCALCRDQAGLFDPDCDRVTLTALVGAPGSGKSTYAATLAGPSGVVLSSDALRAEVGTGPGDQTVSAAAVTLLRQRCRALLSGGTSAMVDATNTTAVGRRGLLDIARQTDARPVAVLFDVPLAVCLARNASRPPDRRVPDARLRRYWRSVGQLTPGTLLGEGWAAVRVADEHGALTGVWLGGAR
jgi:predicted kinase